MFKFALLFTLLILTNFSSQARDIYYPGGDSKEYVIELLKHILSHPPSGTFYQVKPSGLSLPKSREFDVMNSNDGIDVIAGGSTLEREAESKAIHFPLLKGLYGWRIALVHKDNSELFHRTNTLVEFKALIPGQFHLWSDTAVLEANNITVAKGADYEGLYSMLDKKRFDYFPRSIIEINRNYNDHKNLAIAIDQYALIHYPSAYYFYVRNDDYTLAQDITHGLEQAHVDGSLEKLFMAYYGETINRIKHEKRKIFTLGNPILSKETPLDRKELWLNF